MVWLVCSYFLMSTSEKVQYMHQISIPKDNVKSKWQRISKCIKMGILCQWALSDPLLTFLPQCEFNHPHQ